MHQHIGPTADFTTHAFLERVRMQFDVAEAILFGSRAHGDFLPDSDADIAVLLRGEPGKLVSTTLEMSDVAYDVLLDTVINVSPLSVWLVQPAFGE